MIVNLPSRADLLHWISQLTNNKVQRLEDLSDAVQFCQIFDKIYPKIINLNKLKRDVKTSLDKEKNFRILLNAIDSLNLSLTINIIDLANKKVSSILELLQWMYKEYHKPSKQIGENDGKENRFNESRMIKSYVGNLFTRQKSLHKNVEKSEISQSVPSRKSLDARLQQFMDKPDEDKKSVSKSLKALQNQSEKNQKSEKQSEKLQGSEKKLHDLINQSKAYQSQSERKKLIQNGPLSDKNISVQKGLINRQGQILIDQKQPCNVERENDKGECKDMSFGKDHAQKTFLEKSERWKKDKQLKEQEGEENFQNIKQVLQRALTGSKQLISLKLSKVTDVALENNPELEEKLKTVLRQVEDSKKNRSFAYSAGNQSRSVLSSVNNSSLQCQNDTFEDIEIDGPSQTQVMPSEYDLQKIEIIVEGPESSPNHQSNKQPPTDKKETVKKSLMKPKEDKPQPSILLSNNLIKQISAQKQKTHNVLSQIRDQNKQTNDSSINKFMNKFAQKFGNQGAFVTEKKIQQKPEISEKREFHSDNSHINHRRNEQLSKNDQNMTESIPVNPLPLPEAIANPHQNQKKEQNQYPELPEYPQIFNSSQCRFF